ncbi:hypothetical protein [Streptomyces sp. HPF1205]|uniref:hypothetical protein n=1 Tax=Streptomyces sp. HPF1205 TaxID=2873262 RepID=UPI001CEDE8A6|nr:hypothetical protein [Streptomyces sp. HPF1205]
MTSTLCVGHKCGTAPHGSRPRRSAAPGLRLCTTCYHDLKASLLELPEIYDDCESVLHPRRNPTLQRVSGSRQSTGIRLDEAAISARSGIVGFLASWAALVADERPAHRPAHRSPGALSDFLLTHLNWLLAHPTAADFAAEISEVTHHARRSAYTQPALRIDLGECIHADCGAAMTTAPSARDGNRTREVSCTAGHTWQPHQWLLLSRQIQQGRHGRGPSGTATRTQRPEGVA